MFKFLLKYSIILAILMVSCSKDDCFKSAGEDTVKTLTLDSFRDIEIKDRFNIILVQDSVNYAKIEGKSNLVDKLSLTVQNGKLILKDGSSCQVFKGYHTTDVELHFVDFKYLFMSGNSNLSSMDTLYFDDVFFESQADVSRWDLKMKSDSLTVKLRSLQGELTLSGQVRGAYIYTSGTNHIYARNLLMNNLYVNHDCQGDIYASVKESLGVFLNDRGNVYCYGNPPKKIISYGKTGTGFVRFID